MLGIAYKNSLWNLAGEQCTFNERERVC